MKTVYLIRHAKSSWNFPELKDSERPLNNRGRRDAPFMGELLKSLSVKPDKIVSSPALRAITTAIYFSKAFEIPKEEIKVDLNIYEAFPGTIMRLIQEFDNDWNTVILFGHNPAFTEVINWFSEQYISNLPTCGIGKIIAPISSWADFSPDSGKLIASYFPKEYSGK